MNKTDLPLSKEEFDAIYSKVPRLTVEIIVRNGKGEIFLTQRAIEPCKGQWHLPGGTVFFAESLAEAVKRVAKRELGITVTTTKHVGYIEYPSHYQNGLDTPVGIAFEVTGYGGDFTVNGEAEGSGWFTALPAHTHADQDVFLVRNGYLRGSVRYT
jgi:ADP-ribose pyrophosphatase YjhB (NUDIX family)